ncbi:hypothetical protein F2Q68_00011262 [Brassica cretica]|uniref:Uncharacterized protein n=1 Tax=Brassica cretica TaxID=69181 RepID=A0A8S9KR06_BRACR|nr:hypothetical protein F2Q68_00011262 [Brassica cretica]
MLSMSKQAFTPHLIQGIDVSRYYLEVLIQSHTRVEKLQVVLEPYTKNVRHGYKMFVESTKVYHQQAQEILKNNEITKPVATMDLALGWGQSFDWFPSHIHHQIAFCRLQVPKLRTSDVIGKYKYSVSRHQLHQDNFQRRCPDNSLIAIYSPSRKVHNLLLLWHNPGRRKNRSSSSHYGHIIIFEALDAAKLEQRLKTNTEVLILVQKLINSTPIPWHR